MALPATTKTPGGGWKWGSALVFWIWFRWDCRDRPTPVTTTSRGGGGMMGKTLRFLHWIPDPLLTASGLGPVRVCVGGGGVWHKASVSDMCGGGGWA